MQDENDDSKKWNKQEENKKKKQSKLSKYGKHRIIELWKVKSKL